jgi:hypothetical protein
MTTITELTEQEMMQTSVQATIGRLTDAVQNYMDAVVRQRGYDSLLSACTYATSKNAPFQFEGQACIEWRDAVWLYCNQLMENVIAGNAVIPSESDLIQSLPTLNW